MFKCGSNGQLAIGLVIGSGITIFAIIWIIGLNYCPESPCNYDYEHSHGPTDGPTQHQGWIPNPRLPNFTLQTEPTFSEGNPKEYEYADLQAQENMARATNWIVWVSIFSSIVAAAGVALLIFNLNATRQAVLAAKESNKVADRANDAAFRSADVTERIGKAQTRAYLTATIGKLRVVPARDWGVHVGILIENKGNSPALNTVSATSDQWIIQEQNLKDGDIDFDIPDRPINASVSNI